MLIFLLLFLPLQNRCSPVYLKEKKNCIFIQLYRPTRQCSASSPNHQERRKISGPPLGTPRVVMLPVFHTAVCRAGFHLLLFWHTLILCWLAQQYSAIVPCLRGISSWIRIQSLCAVNLLNYVVKEMLFCP